VSIQEHPSFSEITSRTAFFRYIAQAKNVAKTRLSLRLRGVSREFAGDTTECKLLIIRTIESILSIAAKPTR
jgi:hypothetical protein